MEIQTPVQQVPEVQKSSNKWLVPVSLAAVVVAGVFLYAYLTPAQNDDGIGGEEQQAKAGKTVVVYEREFYVTPTSVNTQIVVANIDGSEKHLLFSPNEGRTGFVSPKTGEYVYVTYVDEKNSPRYDFCRYKIVARSLRGDFKERMITEGYGNVSALRLSTDGERLAFVHINRPICEKNIEDQIVEDVDEVLLTLSLENPEDITTASLPENPMYYTGHNIGFYDGTNVLITNLGENYPDYVWGVFTADGSKIDHQFITPPRFYQDLFGGDETSSDGEMVVVHESDKNREKKDHPTRIVYPNKIVVRSTKDGAVVSTNFSGEHEFIYFERWIKDTRAFIYRWEELEKGGDIEGDFTPTYQGYDSADEVVVNMNRYGVFDVETEQKYEFMTRREMNKWIAERYPQEPRFEIVHVGKIKTYVVPDEPNVYQAGQTKYLQEIVSSRSYINDALIEESPINLLGFSEI